MNINADYKSKQAETREKLKPKLLYSDVSPIYLGIKEAKRRMSKPDAAKYKQEAWSIFRAALKTKKK